MSSHHSKCRVPVQPQVSVRKRAGEGGLWRTGQIAYFQRPLGPAPSAVPDQHHHIGTDAESGPPTPDPLSQNLHFSKMPRRYVRARTHTHTHTHTGTLESSAVSDFIVSTPDKPVF